MKKQKLHIHPTNPKASSEQTHVDYQTASPGRGDGWPVADRDCGQWYRAADSLPMQRQVTLVPSRTLPCGARRIRLFSRERPNNSPKRRTALSDLPKQHLIRDLGNVQAQGSSQALVS
jgi:hypothetical protein